MLGGVWDRELLDALYAGAACYLHGHSVGGTNPSLLRALGAGASVAAFDVDFNREVIGEAGVYFAEEDDVTTILKQSRRTPRRPGSAARRDAARSRSGTGGTTSPTATRPSAAGCSPGTAIRP
jgi:hypothetical protein